MPDLDARIWAWFTDNDREDDESARHLSEVCDALCAVLALGSGGHIGYVEFIHPTKATTHIAIVGENGDVLADGYATVEDFHLANARGLVTPLIRTTEIRDTVARELGVSDA